MKRVACLLFGILTATALQAQMHKIEWKPLGSVWRTTSGTALAKPTIIGVITSERASAQFWGTAVGSAAPWSTIEANTPSTYLGYDYFSGQDLQLYKPGLPPGPDNWSFKAWNTSVRFGILGAGYAPDWQPCAGKVYGFTREPLRLSILGKTLEQFGVQACRYFEWRVYYPRAQDGLMTRDNYQRFFRKSGIGEVSVSLTDIAPPQSTFTTQNPEASRGTFVVVEVFPTTYSFGEVLVTLEDL